MFFFNNVYYSACPLLGSDSTCIEVSFYILSFYYLLIPFTVLVPYLPCHMVFLNNITLNAPLLCSNNTCIEVSFYILSSTIYLFHLKFWFLIYLVIFIH